MYRVCCSKLGPLYPPRNPPGGKKGEKVNTYLFMKVKEIGFETKP